MGYLELQKSYMAFIGHCKSHVLEVSDVVDRNFDYFKSDLK